MLEASEARALLDSIDGSTDAGLRDRALVGLMVYSFRADRRGALDAGGGRVRAEPPGPYAWETSEPQPKARKRVRYASVNDCATGEGLSVYFAAALARGEDEFRRSIASELGRELANKAEVRLGVSGFSPGIEVPPAHLRQHSGSAGQGKGPACDDKLSRPLPGERLLD